VRFDSPECRFEFDNRVLHQPLAAADPQLYRIVRLHAQNKIEEHERAGDIVFRVTEYLAEAFKHGDVNLANAADSLGMSARTLQRELEEAGTSFRDLVDETRKSLAQHFLLGTSLPLTEIAFLLGFSELSAFSRAARVWFGAPPSDLRKSGAGQPSS
jgi:AraC-like DNA-binding protein